MNRQTPTEPVTTEIKIWDVRPELIEPDVAARYVVGGLLTAEDEAACLVAGIRKVGAYNWRSHPIRFGLHEMGQLAESVRWNFPPLRPYGVTRERP